MGETKFFRGSVVGRGGRGGKYCEGRGEYDKMMQERRTWCT